MHEIELSVLVWRTPTTSEETNCVQVAAVDGHVLVRDSKHAGNGLLTFSTTAWMCFLQQLRDAGIKRKHARAA